MHDAIKPGIALLIIAAIAAAILGYVNYITAAPIKQADLNTTIESVKVVLPEVNADALTENDIVNVEDPDSEVTSYIAAKDADGNIIGYAISVETKGFGSGLKLMYGIDTEGKITGLSAIDCSNETPGLGANVKTDANFCKQFIGMEGGDGKIKVDKDGGEIHSLTGATITSRAVSNAANTAADFYFKNILKEGGAN